MQEALFPALFLEIIWSNHPQLFLCTIFKMFCLLAVLLIYLYVTERPKIKAKRCTKFFNEAKFLFEVAFQFWVFQNSAIMHTEYITYVSRVCIHMVHMADMEHLRLSPKVRSLKLSYKFTDTKHVSILFCVWCIMQYGQTGI